MPSPPEDLDLLFPLPSHPPSVLSLITPTGLTSESTETVTRLAQAAVHNVRTSNLLTRKFLTDSAATESLANAFAKKVSLKSDKSVSIDDFGSYREGSSSRPLKSEYIQQLF
ncbi:hypothetical protein M422DRAFT_250411 [Sphaerobolus stellatus SS14]|uniref:Uncharacterized protein n=1 Tax=Sphaerobolus stellatus (strain SS14) TaxID=990650 RepID=A0A0C9VTR6_SPHS4|nr:hypothetical protein M422DRAFT_250411 [Sphaerobolus stellatus SS14]